MMSQGNGQDDAMSDSYCVDATACDGPVPRRRSMVGGVLRHRKGSSKYYDSVAQLPDGPVDREAFGNWPRRLMADLFNGQPLRCKRAESFIELGEVLHTDFSGVGGAEMSKRIQHIILQEFGFRLADEQKCVCWRACDISPSCLRALADPKHHPVHVFQSLTDRLPSPHREAIIGMRAKLDKCGKPVDLAEARRAHHAMAKYLRQHGPSIFLKNATSSTCTLHPGQECMVSWPSPPAGTSLRPLTTAVGGTMCTPWAQYGDHLGESHPANEAYFV
jgi:hypothetical protein